MGSRRQAFARVCEGATATWGKGGGSEGGVTPVITDCGTHTPYPSLTTCRTLGYTLACGWGGRYSQDRFLLHSKPLCTCPPLSVSGTLNMSHCVVIKYLRYGFGLRLVLRLLQQGVYYGQIDPLVSLNRVRCSEPHFLRPRCDGIYTQCQEIGLLLNFLSCKTFDYQPIIGCYDGDPRVYKWVAKVIYKFSPDVNRHKQIAMQCP